MFEYRILKVNNLPLFGNGDNVEGQLNQMGSQGWELIQVADVHPITLNFLIFSTNKLHKEHVFYFKRERKEDPGLKG